MAALLAGSCTPGSRGSASIDTNAPDTGFSVGGDSSPFTITGPEGGPFPNGSRTYTLINSSPTRAIEWQVEAGTPWLSFSEPGGLLGPGASTDVVVSLIEGIADTLPPANYPADIVFWDARSPGNDYEIFLAFLLRVLPSPDGATLSVSPEDDVTVTGQVDGDLDSTEVTYTLENLGKKALDWEMSVDQNWMQLPDTWAGSLGPGDQEDVVLSIDEAATGYLTAGTHRGMTRFQVTSGPPGEGIERFVDLELSDGENSEGRVEEGLIALYDFEQMGGDLVVDVSGIEPSLDLQIQDMGSVTWLSGALAVESPTLVRSDGPAQKIIQSCSASGEITLEVWLQPANLTQDGPARVLTLSDGSALRNFTLGQGLWDGQPSDTFNVRLRTTQTDLDGMPMVASQAGTAKPTLQHLVYTRDSNGTTNLYVDGEVIDTDSVGGAMTNWGGYMLGIANEFGANRPWLGNLHLAAVYERALSETEVQQNFDAGTGDAESAHLAVTPHSTFYTSVSEGEEPLIDSRTYTVSNPGKKQVMWEAAIDAPWIFLEGTTHGVLEPGGQRDLEVNLDLDLITEFSTGIYEAYVTFHNLTNDMGSTERLVQLLVTGEDGGDHEWVSQVTQYGITWHFQQPALSGQFVGGDTWVVGPVTVTHVSPSPTGTRNGSMLNPRPKDNGVASGFDNRVPYADMSLQVGFPVTLQGGDSLLSTISQSNDPFPLQDVIGKTLTNFSWLRTAAVLTVVNNPKPATSFRPPYAYSPSDYPSGVKPIFDSADLRWDKLPTSVSATSGALAFHPDSSLTPLQQVAKYFERPWVLCARDWPGRQTHPSENMPNYHREVYNVIADASLLLMIDASALEKKALMDGFVQVGIDMMGCGLKGGADSSMHKWPTIFAGVMLDDEWMSGGSKHTYRTDYMTYFPHERLCDVTSDVVPPDEGWTGATVLWRQDAVSSPVTEHEHLHPTEWQSKNTSSGGGKKREAYRRSNSYTWPGAALAAHMMGATDGWDHPQFFAYVDRWMTEYDASNMAYLEDLFNYSLYIGGKGAGSAFVKSMWQTYRVDY